MKKLLTFILLISMIAALTACGNKTEKTTSNPNKNEDASIVTNSEAKKEEAEEKTEVEAEKEEPKKEELKKEESVKDEPKEEKGEAGKEEKPVSPPSQKDEEDKAPETNTNTTLGNTLLSDFKEQAKSGKSTLEIAETLIANPAITFNGGAMSVEEGLLSGFDNTEIKGFKSGAMFAPMIGSIAFVGYVFELPEGTDTASFISTLRNSANLRWNICVEAEEMVTGSVGNKVFFVMCPKSPEN